MGFTEALLKQGLIFGEQFPRQASHIYQTFSTPSEIQEEMTNKVAILSYAETWEMVLNGARGIHQVPAPAASRILSTPALSLFIYQRDCSLMLSDAGVEGLVLSRNVHRDKPRTVAVAIIWPSRK